MTVQDLIKKANKENVFKLWWETRKDELEIPDKNEKSKYDIYKENAKELLINGIVKMETATCNKSSDSVVVMCEYYDLDENDELITTTDIFAYSKNELKNWNDNGSVCKKYDDIENKVHYPQSFSLMFIKSKELLGYNVSEQSIEKFGIDKFAWMVLEEFFFFGFDYNQADEKIDKEVSSLLKSVEEVKNGGNTYSMDEVNEEMKKKYPELELDFKKDTEEHIAELRNKMDDVSVKNTNVMLDFYRKEKAFV